MSEHMALHDHIEGDVSIRLVDFESNWGKRRIKESITVRELRPSLNGNDALYLSPIYGLWFLRSTLKMIIGLILNKDT